MIPQFVLAALATLGLFLGQSAAFAVPLTANAHEVAAEESEPTEPTTTKRRAVAFRSRNRPSIHRGTRPRPRRWTRPLRSNAWRRVTLALSGAPRRGPPLLAD